MSTSEVKVEVKKEEPKVAVATPPPTDPIKVCPPAPRKSRATKIVPNPHRSEQQIRKYKAGNMTTREYNIIHRNAELIMQDPIYAKELEPYFYKKFMNEEAVTCDDEEEEVEKPKKSHKKKIELVQHESDTEEDEPEPEIEVSNYQQPVARVQPDPVPIPIRFKPKPKYGGIDPSVLLM
jgi:hypothetical protein